MKAYKKSGGRGDEVALGAGSGPADLCHSVPDAEPNSTVGMGWARLRVLVAAGLFGAPALVGPRPALACSVSPHCEECGVRLVTALDGATLPPDAPIAVELRCYEREVLELVGPGDQRLPSTWEPFAPEGSPTGVFVRTGPELPVGPVSLVTRAPARCAEFYYPLDPADADLVACPLPRAQTSEVVVASFEISDAAELPAPHEPRVECVVDAEYGRVIVDNRGWDGVLAYRGREGLQLAHTCDDGSVVMGSGRFAYLDLNLQRPAPAMLSYQFTTYDFWGEATDHIGTLPADACLAEVPPVVAHCPGGDAFTELPLTAPFADLTTTATCSAARTALQREQCGMGGFPSSSGGASSGGVSSAAGGAPNGSGGASSGGAPCGVRPPNDETLASGQGSCSIRDGSRTGRLPLWVGLFAVLLGHAGARRHLW